MNKLGLIGFPLSHSFSPTYFAKKFKEQNISDWQYDAYPIPSIQNFQKLWKDESLMGLNVTIPYKQLVIPFLDRLDESASAIGAVNTVKREGTELVGYNTDIFGFEYSVKELIGKNSINNALILGTGGASKAVKFVLGKLVENEVKFVSRSKKKGDFTYEELTEKVLSNHQLIVNTTPLGTYPNINSAPDLNYNHINSHHYLFDLVYNPPKTLFLEKGEKRGAKTMNGLLMLHQQAEKSWDIWTSASH